MSGLQQQQTAHTSAPPFTSTRGSVLQRACACGQHSGNGGECEACRRKRLNVQRQAAGQAPYDVAPPIVHEVLGTPGQPLDPAVRAFLEPRFGRDFSHVRVHTDSKAAASARAVNALAYTAGPHIAFGEGQYQPRVAAGQVLLAHELTHVIQQRNGSVRNPTKLDAQGDRQEQEANTTALGIMAHPDKSDTIPIAAETDLETVRRGWPLVVGIVAAVAAGAYGIWAYTCLNPLERPMYNETFGDPARMGGFRLWYYNQTHAPVSSNVWDAFGHCWIACASTQRCGSFTASFAGGGREFWREYIDSEPHDSYTQDTNNQRLGRGFGSSGQNCTIACRNAALPGGGMDLNAPQASFWTPARGDYAAPATPPVSVPTPAGTGVLDAGVPSSGPTDAGLPLPGGIP